jgi:GDP-L-fucose synthase
MTIGVIGATGLVGRHVVEALAAAGSQPVVGTYQIRAPYEVPHTSWVKCDLRERAMKALGSVETAIICAEQLSTSAVLRIDPITSILDTLRLLTNVFEAAARLRVGRVIMISSCTGYPALFRPPVEADMVDDDPPAQWFGVGWMHRYLEKQLRWYVEQLGLIGSAIVLRPTLVYGPYDDFSPETGHFVPALIRKVVERARPIDIWGDGSQTCNLLHAADLASAVLAVLPRPSAPLETFNVVSPRDASVNEAVRHLIEIDGFSDAVVVHDLARSGGLQRCRSRGQRSPPKLAGGRSLAFAKGWPMLSVGIDGRSPRARRRRLAALGVH